MAPRLLSRQSRYVLYKFWALLGLVRWYNILVMSLALYLSAIYLFPAYSTVIEALLDFRLHLAVLALVLLIASGFIINAFYDLEKDMINRPKQTFFKKHISSDFSLRCYFLFNTLAALLSAFVHWQVFLFNVFFSLVLWAYSHKMRKLNFAGELVAALLTIAPFFSLALYYQDITWKLVEFAALIFVFILAREIVKKLISIKGDIIMGDRSLPIQIGEQSASRLIMLLALGSIAQLAFFVRFLLSGWVEVLFYTMAALAALVILFQVLRYPQRYSNSLYKILILLSVLSIPFIQS